MGVTASPSQINAFMVTERITSIFSLFGILFILSTFLLARGFDKPINRLIFFASWSNLGMNIASLIAQDGIAAGQSSALCQFQSFTIQMFLGVDVFWALCMAFNVYLALFRGWTASRMRAQEWKYFIGCYGASFVPAFIYLFVKSDSRGRVYGPALLWCWITSDWDFLRVATLYGIVWLAILFAFTIYTMAFTKVWRQRHELHGLFNPFNEDPFAHTTVTTEINVVSAPMPAPSRVQSHDEPKGGVGEPRFTNDIFRMGSDPADAAIRPGEQSKPDFDPYSVDVEVGEHIQNSDGTRRPSNRPEVFHIRNLTRQHALSETNPDAWLYARVAFLFFCALLISWVPSSINRLYSIAHPDALVFGLNYTETLVLPLQGFWNAIVYIITSQTACRNLWRAMLSQPLVPRRDAFIARGDGQGLDAAGNGGKGIGMGMMMKGGSAAGNGGGGGGGPGKKGTGLGGKVERYVSRSESQRLGRGTYSDESIAKLTEVHQHQQRRHR